MNLAYSTLLRHLLVILSIAVNTVTGQGGLKFRPDGTFTIVQFADLHYGETDGFDAKSDKIQALVLVAEKPDLVVYSGDQVSAWFWNNEKGFYAKHFNQLIKPTLDAKVPFAVILGNHDDEGDLNRRQVVQLAIDTDAQLSYTKQGPLNITGASNYYIDVGSSKNESTAARIWMLDSMDRGCGTNPDGWGCVGTDTVQWMKTLASTLPPVPTASLYVHIPIQEFMPVWNNSTTYGTKNEAVSCPLENTGVLAAAKEIGIQAITSGHDHDNVYYGLQDGVKLEYGRKSGYGSYGPSDCAYRGATVTKLREGESAANAETWIREENGNKRVLQASIVPKDELQDTCAVGGSFYPAIPVITNNRELLGCKAPSSIQPRSKCYAILVQLLMIFV